MNPPGSADFSFLLYIIILCLKHPFFSAFNLSKEASQKNDLKSLRPIRMFLSFGENVDYSGEKKRKGGRGMKHW